MDKKSIKIIFFGTPRFAGKALQALIDNGYNVVGVVTQPDKPVGRKQELQKSSVKILAESNSIPVISLERLADLKPDLGILFAYGEIIPELVLEVFPKGILNIHPSLLPKYRGSSPVQAAILNGDEITGVSIIKLDNIMDHGPIVAQQEVVIKKDETAEKLLDRLAEVGTKLLIKILPDYMEGRIELQPQDDSQASYTRRVNRRDGQINWRRSAVQIERQFRAFHPWPGVYTHWGKKRLKITKLGQFRGDFEQNLTPGTVFLGPDSQLLVACADEAIVLEIVQLEGRKEVDGRDFLNGNKEIIGAVLK
jgi:methionyl-tRNA formyltransferase